MVVYCLIGVTTMPIHWVELVVCHHIHIRKKWNVTALSKSDTMGVSRQIHHRPRLCVPALHLLADLPQRIAIDISCLWVYCFWKPLNKCGAGMQRCGFVKTHPLPISSLLLREVKNKGNEDKRNPPWCGPTDGPSAWSGAGTACRSTDTAWGGHSTRGGAAPAWFNRNKLFWLEWSHQAKAVTCVHAVCSGSVQLKCSINRLMHLRKADYTLMLQTPCMQVTAFAWWLHIHSYNIYAV